LSISESIAKFPLPEVAVSAAGVRAAQEFNDLAVQWSRDNDTGMTDVMNAIHSPDNTDPQIEELRRVLQEIDAAVAAAYGWDDLDLTYSFVEQDARASKDKWRFQISEVVRAEILARLLDLNRQRSESCNDLLMAGGGR
jgi:hypothetical protein